MSPAKQRVAILGGGAGSMTAAYYLCSTPERRERFEVTVYQMGWRLGGKGANGRRASAADRIEEHGLHVWGGFYHNAFRTMRECYEALGRADGAPLSRIDEAFLPAPDVFWEERVDGAWRNWPVVVPRTGGAPWEGGELPSIADYLEMIVGFVHDAIDVFPHEDLRQRAQTPHPGLADRLAGCVRGMEHLITGAVDLSVASVIRVLRERAMALRGGAAPGEHHVIADLLDHAWRWLHEEGMHAIENDDESRRIYVLTDLAIATACGIVRDRVLEDGFTAIDGQDFADWLRSHGASELSLTSAPLRGYYDYFFAYEQGDPARPRMSAAMGLYHLLRLTFTYKESLFFKMASGMGDTVFGPLYEVCRRNGVQFRFFHEVLEVVPDAGRDTVAAVRLNRQVDTKADYQPLRNIKGLPSWPAEPLLDQVRDDQAARILAEHIDLEDPWSGWDGGTGIELRAGRDFDLVVLGIPVGAHRALCPRLIERHTQWRDMVEGLQTIQTAALQLWWTKSIDSLGVTGPMATGTGYGQPLESWSDMSHVLPLESWPAGTDPRTVVYFCGPMPTPSSTPTSADPAFGKGQKASARRIALEWARACLPHLYPGAMAGSEIDWSALAVTDGSNGEARFDAQYIRANYTPSERYVLDLPGTSRCRLDADASGFDNLLLAGDWVFTGLGGAVESAVIGGMQAAQAIAGEPLGISGALKNPWNTLPKYRPAGHGAATSKNA